MTDFHDVPSAVCAVGVGEKEPQTEDIMAFLTMKEPQKVQPHRYVRERACFQGLKYFEPYF